MKSLQRKSVCINLNKSSIDVDQLAGRLGGNCYFYYLGKDGATQNFLFEQESSAQQFINAVQFYSEFISAEIESL